MNHALKTWPQFFQAVLRGEKPFEIRKKDRPFAVGDTLTLEEFEPCPDCEGVGSTNITKFGKNFVMSHARACPFCDGTKGRYTGQRIMRKVTFILDSGFGLREGYVAMGLKELKPQPS